MPTHTNRRGVIATIAALAATGLTARAQTAGESSEETAAPESDGGGGEQTSADYPTGDIALGDEDAPLTVYEYASLTCPHCATFHMNTWPEVKREYVDTGKVRFILREVYFDQYGLWASMVARCGGERGFYPMVEAFLEQQSAWTQAQDIGEAIQQIGRRAGLSSSRLAECLSDREYAKALLESYQENREAHDIQSTPTFIIDGEKHTGDMSFEEFSALLDDALAS